MAGSINSQRL